MKLNKLTSAEKVIATTQRDLEIGEKNRERNWNWISYTALGGSAKGA